MTFEYDKGNYSKLVNYYVTNNARSEYKTSPFLTVDIMNHSCTVCGICCWQYLILVILQNPSQINNEVLKSLSYQIALLER